MWGIRERDIAHQEDDASADFERCANIEPMASTTPTDPKDIDIAQLDIELSRIRTHAVRQKFCAELMQLIESLPLVHTVYFRFKETFDTSLPAQVKAQASPLEYERITLLPDQGAPKTAAEFDFSSIEKFERGLKRLQVDLGNRKASRAALESQFSPIGKQTKFKRGENMPPFCLSRPDAIAMLSVLIEQPDIVLNDSGWAHIKAEIFNRLTPAAPSADTRPRF